MWRIIRCGLIVAALACQWVLSARADEFPVKPITIMVGLAAGGITDVTARLYAEVVARNVGQRITIENRPAAGGAVAAASVQNAAPDGYTLLVFSGSQHATVAAMGSSPYDPVKGFAFITLLFNSVVAVVVPLDSPAKTLEELFDFGRKKPGGLSMGSPGLGSPSHLLGARLALAAKVPMQSIHYRGGAPMMADVLTGRVDFALPTLSTSRSFLAEEESCWPARARGHRALVGTSGCADTVRDSDTAMRRSRVGSVWRRPRYASGGGAKLRDEFIKASRDPELRNDAWRRRHPDRDQHAR